MLSCTFNVCCQGTALEAVFIASNKVYGGYRLIMTAAERGSVTGRCRARASLRLELPTRFSLDSSAPARECLEQKEKFQPSKVSAAREFLMGHPTTVR